GTGAQTASAARTKLGINNVNIQVVSSPGNFVVPAGVTRIFCILVGGPGGNASDGTLTLFPSVGGTVSLNYGGGSGGAGQIAYVFVDVTPGETIAFSGGTAGSDGADGGNGTDSVLTFTSPSLVVTASAGRGGKGSTTGYSLGGLGAPIVGATALVSTASVRNVVAWAVAGPSGHSGSIGNTTTGPI